MATFKITGPDGKVYRVTGDNAEGALSALQQHLGASAAPAPTAQPDSPVVATAKTDTGQQADPRDNVLGKIDALCLERDRLKDVRPKSKGKVLGGLKW